MTTLWYRSLASGLWSDTSQLATHHICPSIESLGKAVSSNLSNSSSAEFWFPQSNTLLIDFFHVLYVVHIYHPSLLNHYSWKTYLLASIVAAGPSASLRTLLTGEPLALWFGAHILPCLAIALAIRLVTGGLSQRFLSIIRTINIMSSVRSVELSVQFIHTLPHVTLFGCFIVGVIGSAGGDLWYNFVHAKSFGTSFNWKKIEDNLFLYIIFSTFWNVVEMSNCVIKPFHRMVLEFTLYGIILAYRLVVTGVQRNSASAVSASKPITTNGSKNDLKNEKTKVE